MIAVLSVLSATDKQRPPQASLVISSRHWATWKAIKPTFDILTDRLLDLALVRRRNILALLVSASGAETTIGIHGPLERIALPPKDVVAVLAVPRLVTRRQHKRLRAIGWPLSLVVELGRVPDNLKHELRNFDGVTGRAVSGRQEVGGAGGGICDVILVVGRVEVLPVPASVENQHMCVLRTHKRHTLGTTRWTLYHRDRDQSGSLQSRGGNQRTAPCHRRRSWARCSIGSSSAFCICHVVKIEVLKGHTELVTLVLVDLRRQQTF